MDAEKVYQKKAPKQTAHQILSDYFDILGKIVESFNPDLITLKHQGKGWYAGRYFFVSARGEIKYTDRGGGKRVRISRIAKITAQMRRMIAHLPSEKPEWVADFEQWNKENPQ